MARRITSSYFSHYRDRYDNVLQHLVLISCPRRQGHREDMRQIAEREFLFALIHFERGYGTLITFAFRRIHGKLRNYFRQQRRKGRGVQIDTEHWNDLQRPSRDPGLALVVEEVLACLDGTERAIVLAACRDGKSTRDIGEELGMSHDWVWRVRRAALAKIRARFPDPTVVCPWERRTSRPEAACA